MPSPLKRFEQDLGDLLSTNVRGFLLAVSGGADSTALLKLFAGLKTSESILVRKKRIVVGHVHHKIRGAEADADARFVEELATRHDLDCISTEVDVPAATRAGGRSLEETARDLRYELFEQWARERGLDHIVTAHHADDQIETLLFRLSRGTGVAGLSGIRARRPLRDLEESSDSAWLVRPLLSWHRQEILTFLETTEQEFRVDSSNNDTSIPRNALRHEILPLLKEKVHPGSAAALLRLSRTATRLQRDLEALSSQRWTEVYLTDASWKEDDTKSIALSLPALLACPETLRIYLLGMAFKQAGQRLGRNVRGFSERQLEEIARRLGDRDHGRSDSIELAGGWQVHVDGNVLHIRLSDLKSSHAEARDKAEKLDSPTAAAKLNIPGELNWKQWHFQAEITTAEPKIARSDPWSEVVDLDALPGNELIVRGRRHGERFHPLGTGGRKSLKEFFRECGIPARDRDRFPLVATNDTESTVVWVPGKRLAHPYRVTKSTVRWGRLHAEITKP